MVVYINRGGYCSASVSAAAFVGRVHSTRTCILGNHPFASNGWILPIALGVGASGLIIPGTALGADTRPGLIAPK